MYSSSLLVFAALVSVFGAATSVIFPNYEILGDFAVGDLGCNGASPQSPDEIGVTFELFTDSRQGEPLDWTDEQTILNSKFDPSVKTKFIVHGWKDTMAGENWIAMRNAFLDRAEPLNVVCVDWSPGAARHWYMTSRDNTRVVGRIIAQLIRKMVESAGAKYEDMHVIGHSLGAHIAGYAGEACNGQLGRLTGLDPAGPLFEHTEKACKLDKTDAIFVDAMHTDGELIGLGGAGLMEPCGDHDWYPFGGKNQPACKKTFFGKFDVACDHTMAVIYFTESIKGKPFSGSMYGHNLQDLFEHAVACWNGERDCPLMGYFDSLADTFSEGCYLMESDI